MGFGVMYTQCAVPGAGEEAPVLLLQRRRQFNSHHKGGAATGRQHDLTLPQSSVLFTPPFVSFLPVCNCFVPTLLYSPPACLCPLMLLLCWLEPAPCNPVACRRQL